MLILLDIDGVMISAASWKPIPILSDGFPQFSVKAVFNLNQILNETNASIVLTTSHKSRFSVFEWESIFKKRGINTSIQKLEDNVRDLDRKGEILNWIESKWNHENFIIIDDDTNLNGLPSDIKERLILTRPIVGLNEEDANNAISNLKNPPLVIA
ncbi:MAG: HAD domain-containing protein [Bacteroidota bacterium]|nr:HAD domain-containing protein [Bacteroidota bacterium]